MATEERMATPTDILTLAQWFSPAFPVGAFAYSHGLEWAIDSGDVCDGPDTRDWIEQVLRNGAGWNDSIFLALAYHAEGLEELTQIDATCKALASSRERLKETNLQGMAFCQTVSAVWQVDLPGLSFPVAVGRTARREGLPLDLTAQMYLQGFVSNLVSGAMRLVPLGQNEGQAMIRQLTPLCIEIADEAVVAGIESLSASAFLTDIAAMKHETQYSRIFRT